MFYFGKTENIQHTDVPQQDVRSSRTCFWAQLE